MRTHSWLCLMFVSVLAACGGNEEVSVGRDAVTMPRYYHVRLDPRECAWPRCTGYFVEEVNQLFTACPGVRDASQCYIAELDLTAIELTTAEGVELRSAINRGGVVLHGRMAPKEYTGGIFYELLADEAWRAPTSLRAGSSVYRVAQANRVTRDPLYRESILNGAGMDDIYVDAVELAGAPGTSEDHDRGTYSLARSALLVAGENQPWAAGDQRKVLAADQFYDRVPSAFTRRACGSASEAACNEGEFCDPLDENACGASVARSVCRTVPELCTEVWRPVCGCDGHTYGNDCARLGARVALAHQGECAR
jgi:hypothetical protein